MRNKVSQFIIEKPTTALVITNALLIGCFAASVELYKAAKEEGVSKTLKILRILGI